MDTPVRLRPQVIGGGICLRRHRQQCLNPFEWAETGRSFKAGRLPTSANGRRMQTNVEFYKALLLHAIGLDAERFTPTFAMSRAAGWIAHYFEQQATGRIIRPQSVYAGERARRWVTLSER